MAAHACLKNEFTEDGKSHNLMTWPIYCTVTSLQHTSSFFFFFSGTLSGALANNATPENPITKWVTLWQNQPEDHWSCIIHLSAEDKLKSAVIEEKKFKHSPWTGTDNSLRPKFLCQQESLITMVICCKFKKNLFNLTLYISFHVLTNVHSCRSEADNPEDIFWCQQKPLVASVICYKFQKISLKSDFIQFFSWFYTCICLEADNPLGMKFYVNRNILSLWSYVASFKKISLKSDFIQIFSWFYTYI